MDELTSSQISEWEAYDRIDPISKWRDEWGIASLSSLIANLARQIYRDPEEKGELVLTTPLDYLPDWDGSLEGLGKKKVVAEVEDPKKQSPDTIKWLFKQMSIVSKNRKRIKGHKERIRPRGNKKRKS